MSDVCKLSNVDCKQYKVLSAPKVGKLASLYYINGPIIQLPALYCTFDVRPSQQKPEKGQICLTMDPDDPISEKIKSIEDHLINLFIQTRDTWPKHPFKGAFTNEDVTSKLITAYRGPPDDHPEYKPTLRLYIPFIENANGNGNYVIDPQISIFKKDQSIMSDVEMIPKGSKIVAMAKPGWFYTNATMIGLTWIVDSVLVLSTGGEKRFKFVDCEEECGVAEPAPAPASMPKEHDAGDDGIPEVDEEEDARQMTPPKGQNKRQLENDGADSDSDLHLDKVARN